MNGDFATRDLWWEAREANVRHSRQNKAQRLLMNALFVVKTLSLPGRPVKTFQVPSALAARSNIVYFPDLNKYRRGHNLRVYIDAGCRAFMFRIGGPGRWLDGDWDYQLDLSYYEYLDQAHKLGVIDQSIGYIVHNPFELVTINGATGETVHTSLLDDWTSAGRMPKSWCYDHEVFKAFRSTGAEFYVSDTNMADYLAINTDNTYKKFRRTVAVYSSVLGVMKQRGFWAKHETYFSNINKPVTEGGAGAQRPLMCAWYPQNALFAEKVYSGVGGLGQDLLIPNGAQVSAYLWAGHQAQSWQVSDRVRFDGAPQGVDMNISLEDAATFYYNFGLTPPGSTTPPQDPPAEPGPQVTRAEFDALSVYAHNHTHPITIGGPTA